MAAVVQADRHLRALALATLLEHYGKTLAEMRKAVKKAERSKDTPDPLVLWAGCLLRYVDPWPGLLDWAQQQPGRSLQLLLDWRARWCRSGNEVDMEEALCIYLVDHPFAHLLPGALRQALQHLRQRIQAFLAAVRAPPSEQAYAARVDGTRSVTEQYIGDRQGGWYTSVPPLDFFNLLSPLHALVYHLTYHPRYGAHGVAGPGERPERGTFENPHDPEHWLFSVHRINQLLVNVLLAMGGEVARAARRLTPPTAGDRQPRLCCPRLQLLFTDLAVHNDGSGTYECAVSGQRKLQLAGRVPDWLQAFPDHTMLREWLAAVPHGEFQVSIYSGTKGVEYWDEHDDGALDVTEVVAEVCRAVLARAGHQLDASRPLGGLRGARVLLVPRGQAGLELVLMGIHPCATAAHAHAIGRLEEAGAWAQGTLEVVAAALAAVLGRHAGDCFPSPEGMPALSHVQAPPTYGRNNLDRCLGCTMLLNVLRAEDGEKVHGVMPCYGRCAADGLRHLSSTQRDRLKAAVKHRRYSITELEFVRWPLTLAPQHYNQLQGLWGAGRDARLQQLMAEVEGLGAGQ